MSGHWHGVLVADLWYLLAAVIYIWALIWGAYFVPRKWTAAYLVALTALFAVIAVTILNAGHPS